MAASAVTATVKGGPELAAGSRRLFKQIEADAPRRLGRAAEQAAGAVRGRVPKLTGRLAGSVTATAGDRAALLQMGQGVPYAGWIEYGGSRGRPRVDQGRYVYPTALETTPLAQIAAADGAEQEIRGFSWPRVS